ncbi:hypothetical protein HYU23_03720 [Candidatus Woesearchaeota archaeon]|nr:hypothetical protein [Candidatus Woesearchaeota archaeon]
MGIKKLMYGAITIVGFVALVKGCIELYWIHNKQELIYDQKTTNDYLELEKLADIDHDGNLSNIEKTLMYERLDNCNNYSDVAWNIFAVRIENKIKEGRRIYWGPNEGARINRALRAYRNIRK